MNETNSIFIKIYGGESLLYINNVKRYLIELYKYKLETSLPIFCTIITNGTIMPEHFLKFIKDLDLDISFSFSFEINEEFQNKIRHFKNNPNIGSYDIITKNLNKYRSILSVKRVHLQSVLTPELLLNVNKYIDFMEKHKDEYLFDLNPMFDKTFSNYDKTILENMKILFDYYIEKIKLRDDKHIGLFQPIRSITSYFISETESCLYHCPAGVNQITLMSNGDIYPCSKIYHLENEDMKYGNISEPIEILSERINSQKKLFKTLTIHDSICNKCKSNFKFGCLGDCMAERLNNNNNHYEWVCEYNKIFGLETMRMVKELKDDEYFLKRLEKNQNSNLSGFNSILFTKIKSYE